MDLTEIGLYGNRTFNSSLLPSASSLSPTYCTFWRYLTDFQMQEIARELKRAFPAHSIEISSDNQTLSRARLDELILQQQRAHIFVGLHGAGLTNVMFMNRDTYLVEIVGEFDGRMLPLSGYVGPQADVFGVHHYIFSFDGLYEPLDPTSLAREVKDFVGIVQKTKKEFGIVQKTKLGDATT